MPPTADRVRVPEVKGEAANTEAPKPQSPLRVGTLVDERYRVVREIGGGGMGYVFEVEHVALGRRFALKVLRVGHWDDELIRRFRREARALARVHSPRVAQVSDFGVAENVGPYYVMELVDGESLQARLDRDGAIPIPEAVALAVALCEAVHDVHTEGLVHRDLKPGNIGLTLGKAIPVKLLDFGLAAGVDDAFLTRITQSHQVLGSLPYIAPEQFSGSRPNAAQDLWALGVVIYEMLTARLPFEAPSTAAMMHKILTSPPPILDGFPPPLRAVIGRLLMKSPEARIGSAKEAAELLRQLDVASLPRTIQSLASLPPTMISTALPEPKLAAAQDATEPHGTTSWRPANLDAVRSNGDMGHLLERSLPPTELGALLPHAAGALEQDPGLARASEVSSGVVATGRLPQAPQRHWFRWAMVGALLALLSGVAIVSAMNLAAGGDPDVPPIAATPSLTPLESTPPRDVPIVAAEAEPVDDVEPVDEVEAGASQVNVDPGERRGGGRMRPLPLGRAMEALTRAPDMEADMSEASDGMEASMAVETWMGGFIGGMEDATAMEGSGMDSTWNGDFIR